MEHADWLNDALVFLVAAGLIVPFFHRARIGAVLGFLAVGVLVGPYGFGRLVAMADWVRYVTIEEPGKVAPFAEWGVIFLLFLLGLESSAGKLWDLRRYVFGVGGLQMTISALLIAGVAMGMGLAGRPAVVLGLCLALSSTAIVMQLLIEEGRVSTHTGRIALGVLLFQDLMVVPILFVTGALASEAPFDPVALARTLGLAVAVVGGIMVAGRFALRPLLGFAARTGSRELIMAIALLMVLGAAGATGAAGLSSALGAFIAGLLLSESEYRHQIEVDLEPFKGLLLGLFFVTVGMMLDPLALMGQIWIVLGALAALLLIKGGAFYAASAGFGVPTASRIELTLLLAQAGEFGFIVIGLGRASGLFDADIGNAALAVAVLSMMLTPLLAKGGEAAARRIDRRGHEEQGPSATEDYADHIVVAGFGRVGQMIAGLLESENLPYLALDLDGDVINGHQKPRNRVFFGDASRQEILQRAGASRARAFVVTLADPQATEGTVRAIRRMRPDAPVLARVKDAERAARLAQLGVTDMIPETVDASLQLGGRLLELLGLPDEAVDRRIEQARQRELERLRRAAATE